MRNLHRRTKQVYRSDYRMIEWYADQYGLDLTNPKWSIQYVEQRRDDGAYGATLLRNLEGGKYHGLIVHPLAIRRAEHFRDQDGPRVVDGIGLRFWCDYIMTADATDLNDPRSQVIVRLVANEGYSGSQVADALDVDASTTRVILKADGRPDGIRIDDIRRWGKARRLYGYGVRTEVLSVTLAQVEDAIARTEIE